MTEFSLGSDTSLNALVDACDAIKQNASARRNKYAGVTCDVDDNLFLGKTGTPLVYTPEQGMDLNMLCSGESEGRLVIRSVSLLSSFTLFHVHLTLYTTDMFREEGGGLFDSRRGVPTPMDRGRAARLSLRCMASLEDHHQSLLAQLPKSRCASPESAAVITIQGSALKRVPVTEMVKRADMRDRKEKEA
ncbi:hypothetical protein EDD15DRAFT_2510899 [Pisolithus albus]|nr:hypothetical protein EDD15DRAFT_2510899 [Pisolithus albus]